MAIGQDTPIDSRISLNRPIPGQSLTGDPDSPWPWEKPPEYTNFTDATNYLVSLLIQEKNYLPIMDTIADGTPLMDLTQGILFKGFMEGKWNPDLMMLLAEPLCYMLLAFCERADIDPVIYSEEDDDLADEATLFNVSNNKAKLNNISKSSIPSGVLSDQIEQEIKTADLPSLLSKDNTVERNNESLLGRN